MASSSSRIQPPRAEQGFWAALEGVRTKLDRKELRELALGLAFFRYLSEAFAARRAWLVRESHNPRSFYFCLHEGHRRAMLERAEVYRSAKVVWIPPAARWERLRAALRHPNLGRTIDAAIISFEQDNPELAGLLPRDYARPELGREALVTLMENVERIGAGEGNVAEALSRLCAGFVPRRPALSLVPPAHERTPLPPFARLLERLDGLDGQVRELDRLIEQSQALRARSGRA